MRLQNLFSFLTSFCKVQVIELLRLYIYLQTETFCVHLTPCKMLITNWFPHQLRTILIIYKPQKKFKQKVMAIIFFNHLHNFKLRKIQSAVLTFCVHSWNFTTKSVSVFTRTVGMLGTQTTCLYRDHILLKNFTCFFFQWRQNLINYEQCILQDRPE